MLDLRFCHFHKIFCTLSCHLLNAIGTSRCGIAEPPCRDLYCCNGVINTCTVWLTRVRTCAYDCMIAHGHSSCSTSAANTTTNAATDSAGAWRGVLTLLPSSYRSRTPFLLAIFQIVKKKTVIGVTESICKFQNCLAFADICSRSVPIHTCLTPRIADACRWLNSMKSKKVQGQSVMSFVILLIGHSPTRTSTTPAIAAASAAAGRWPAASARPFGRATRHRSGARSRAASSTATAPAGSCMAVGGREGGRASCYYTQ